MPRSVGSDSSKKDKEYAKEKLYRKDRPGEKNGRKSQTEVERVCSSTTRRTTDHERKHSVRPTDELKLLQDSLTQFFTPSAGRRCRQPPRKFDESGINSDDGIQPSDSGYEKGESIIEKPARRKKSVTDSLLMKPLSVDIDLKTECTGSFSSALSAPSEPSPSRRVCEKLVDSLSPYFSTSSEKRRTTQKGEFAQLNSFRPRGERSPHSPPHSPSSVREVKFDNVESISSHKQMRLPSLSSSRGRRTECGELQPVVGGRGTQNSASAALFNSPQFKEGSLRGRSSSKSHSPPMKRVRTPKIPHTPQGSPRKSNCGGRRSSFAKVGTSAEETTEDDETTAAEMSERETKTSKMRNKRKTFKNSNTTPSDSLTCTTSPSGEKENYQSVDKEGKIRITEQAQRLFDAVQLRAQESIDKALREITSTTTKEPTDEPRWPLAIRLGKYEISTWYSAPYPQEYAHVPILHICEFCLKYMKSEAILTQHMKKCEWRHPPGNEIYRDNNVSVFEVDGNISRIYCQNLCLIAKLFLDHKTLYYDVEPFLFYVVTKNDEFGFHFVGYFSKEKYSQQKFNLSCIVTLPCYQKQGFGRFLIDFSFLLSRRERLMGTPERPLSDLGRISYASYWRTALFEYIHEHIPKNSTRKLLLSDLAKGTGIAVHDIVEVFDALRWFQKQNGSISLVFNWTMIDAHWKKAKDDKTRIWLNESALKWTPAVYTPSKDFGTRVPVISPSSPNPCSMITSTPNGVSLAAVGSTIKKGAAPFRSSRKANATRRLKLDVGASAATSVSRRQCTKMTTTTEEETSSTGGSSSNSEDEERRTRRGCRDPLSKRGRRDGSPDEGNDTDRGTRRGRRGDSSKSTIPVARKKVPSVIGTSSGKKVASGGNPRRGKAVFEEGDTGTNSPSTSSSSESDDLDVSFHINKKPQKGKVPPTQRKKRPALRKPSVKSPGKVFPGNYGQRSPPKAAAVTASPLPGAFRDAASIVPHCDSPTTSVGTAATIPMRLGDSATRCSPGGGRTLQDVEADEEVAAIVASPLPSDRPRLGISSTPPTTRSGMICHIGLRTAEQQVKEGKSSTASSAETSEHSDIEHSHAPSESSRSASSCSSRVGIVDSPRPLGDRVPDHEEAVNMGGVPDDDDGYSRCAPSEESDHPPQLQAEAAIASSAGGASSDEAPPRLHHSHPPPVGSVAVEGPPPLVDGYNTDDDDAPPKLSPANVEPALRTVPPREMTEEEKQQLAMDRPPKAPAMLDKVNDDESEALYSSMLPVQSLPPVDQCSSVPNQQKVTTPLQQYPGSLKQTTPGSVPSCQMQSQHTPEMQQQTFMSPVMQNMCAQPSSVSSVHSTHNSMELASGAGPSSQNAYGGIAPPSVNSSAAHSDPSTPLRASCQGAAPSFGSPPQPASIQTQTPVQEIRMRTSSDSATQQSSTGTRRSGESSRSKHRSNQQQQLQQHQQQQQHMPTMHPMSFTNPYAAHPQTYASYPAAYPTHFDPTTAGFASANPYWQTGYQHYAAAKAGPSMGSMMPTNPAAFPYPYPNGMNPVNGRSQSAAGTWHRYPQGMPTFGSASGNPTPFPVGPSATDFMFNSAAAGYFGNGSYPFNIAK